MTLSAKTVSYACAFKRGLKPDPDLTVSQWADQNRMLSSIASGEPGRWRTVRTKYLQEIMDCLSPSSPIERVVFMKGAQIGGTEAILNWLGYIIACTPAPMMLVMPTVEIAQTTSKQRIDPLIESTPAIKKLISPSRSRDSGNTLMLKEFPGGILALRGANSAAGLRSLPIRFLGMDEVDAYPGDVEGEGDPVALCIQRTATFSNRKIIMVSTPTIKGFSRIEAAYAESDQRRYWVPCPKCKAYQILVWAQIRWSDGHPDQAFYECAHCQDRIHNSSKQWMLENGEWRAENPSATKVAGFHLSSLYSPHGWLSWGDIAVERVNAGKDISRIKTWSNTKLGETWEEEADSISGDDLLDRREPFGTLLPAGVVAITVGIDVQDDRLEAEFVGWGRDEESWSLDHRIIHGDPSGPAVWKDLDALLKRTFPHSRHAPDLKVLAAAIDTGGHYMLAASDFCRSRQDRRIWAIKGRGGPGVKLWPIRPTRNNKGRIPLFIVGVDAAKEAIYARLRINAPGPGYCHFPTDRDLEWFNQLTAESVATRYVRGRPKREWIKRSGDRNEALDCRVYAMACLHGLISMGLQLNKEADSMDKKPFKESGKPVEVIRKAGIRRVARSSWMGG
ncbi:MAG: phage terminase large subunit family protein [Magnetococcales bacterium]|nr:phage terminase large subunit family protein [Magnetococcales bacterium]